MKLEHGDVLTFEGKRYRVRECSNSDDIVLVHVMPCPNECCYHCSGEEITWACAFLSGHDDAGKVLGRCTGRLDCPSYKAME